MTTALERKNEALKALKFAVQMIVEKKYADFLNHIDFSYHGWTKETFEDVINPYLQGKYTFVLPSKEAYNKALFDGLEEGDDLIVIALYLWEVEIDGDAIPFEGDFTLEITYDFTSNKIFFNDLRMK